VESISYSFTQGLDYASVVAMSERVAWTVDEIFRDRCFDSSRTMVPASWVGTESLGFLDEQEQHTLNHCRAFSYVHLLGNYEEFIPLHLADIVQQDWHGDRSHLRALVRFGEEELKHQQLFQRAEMVLEQSCGHPFGRYFDERKTRVKEFTNAFLEHPPLARFLLLLAFEWGTQRHYVESIRNRTEEVGDPLYVDVLRAHWLEEAQHAKSDTLEIARLARQMSGEELCAAFDHLAGLGRLVDESLAGQVEDEIETLQKVTGRVFSEADLTTLRDSLHQSLRAIISGLSLSHPNFTKVALEISAEGAAKLGIA
jgi:hypothetical protein